MSAEDRRGLAGLKPMPMPGYHDAVDYAGRLLPEKWVGFVGSSIDGESKTFLYWRGLKGDIRNAITRQSAAMALVHLKTLGIDGAIGPAIDLGSSDPTTQHVATFPLEEGFGVYVEKDKRHSVAMSGPPIVISEEERSQLLNKALNALPNPDIAEDKMAWREYVRSHPEVLKNDQFERAQEVERSEEDFRTLATQSDPTPENIERAWELYEWVDGLKQGDDFQPNIGIVELRKSLRGEPYEQLRMLFGRVTFQRRTVSPEHPGLGILGPLSTSPLKSEAFERAKTFCNKMLEPQK